MSKSHTRPGSSPSAQSPVGPPTKHQLAFMIWVAVVPTLTILNLTLGSWLSGSGPVLRTVVLASVAVPQAKWLAALIGGGLVFAALSNTCALGTALARMPWNHHRGDSPIDRLLADR